LSVPRLGATRPIRPPIRRVPLRGILSASTRVADSFDGRTHNSAAWPAISSSIRLARTFSTGRSTARRHVSPVNRRLPLARTAIVQVLVRRHCNRLLTLHSASFPRRFAAVEF
jgi:hypothetical protein